VSALVQSSIYKLVFVILPCYTIYYTIYTVCFAIPTGDWEKEAGYDILRLAVQSGVVLPRRIWNNPLHPPRSLVAKSYFHHITSHHCSLQQLQQQTAPHRNSRAVAPHSPQSPLTTYPADLISLAPSRTSLRRPFVTSQSQRVGCQDQQPYTGGPASETTTLRADLLLESRISSLQSRINLEAACRNYSPTPSQSVPLLAIEHKLSPTNKHTASYAFGFSLFPFPFSLFAFSLSSYLPTHPLLLQSPLRTNYHSPTRLPIFAPSRITSSQKKSDSI
jgi:hypothetical protein